MIQEIIKYKNVLNSLERLINESPYKKGFIIEKTGIKAPTFYRKLKTLSFTPDETMGIIRIIKPQEALLYDLKEGIKKAKQEYKDGKVYERSEVYEEIKKLIR